MSNAISHQDMQIKNHSITITYQNEVKMVTHQMLDHSHYKRIATVD